MNPSLAGVDNMTQPIAPADVRKPQLNKTQVPETFKDNKLQEDNLDLDQQSQSEFVQPEDEKAAAGESA